MAKATQYQKEFAAQMAAEENENVSNLPTMVDPEKDEFDIVSTMLDELGEGGEYGELSVFGKPKQQPGQPASRGNVFLMSCASTDYTLSQLMTHIQESWGEGVYTLRGKRGGKYAGQRTIPIGPPSKTEPTAQAAITQAPPIDTTRQLSELFEKMLRQQTETMAAMLGSVITKLDRPPVDPMVMQRDTLALLGSMREVFAPPQVSAPPVPVSSSFSQLKELLEIKKLLTNDDTPSGSDENSLMSMAKQFLPVLMSNAAAQQTAAPQPPQVKASQPKSQVKQLTTTESPAMLEMLQNLKLLIDAAKRDPNFENIELYSELILDRFSVDKIKAFITAPDALDRLAIFSKDVTTYREWFEKVKVTLIGWIEESENDSTNTTENTNDGATDGNPVG